MKEKKTLFLSIIAIAILSLITFWYFKRASRSFSQLELPKFELPEFETFLSQETKEYTEFITPDGKLKLNYPSHWMKMAPEVLEKLNQAITTEKARNLLFTQGTKLEKGAIIFLMVQELFLEEEKSLEGLIEASKEGVKGGREVEISNLKIEGEIAYFEGDYKEEGSPPVYSKEKLILGDNKAYSVIILNLTNNWSEFEEEVNEILNSIQLVS